MPRGRLCSGRYFGMLFALALQPHHRPLPERQRLQRSAAITAQTGAPTDDLGGPSLNEELRLSVPPPTQSCRTSTASTAAAASPFSPTDHAGPVPRRPGVEAAAGAADEAAAARGAMAPVGARVARGPRPLLELLLVHVDRPRQRDRAAREERAVAGLWPEAVHRLVRRRGALPL